MTAAVHEIWRFRPWVEAGGRLFIAGQVGVDDHGRVSLDPETQIRQAFANLGHVLATAGSGWDRLIRLTAASTRLSDHAPIIRRIKNEFLTATKPAFLSIGVTALASPELLFETNAVAERGRPL